MKPVEKNRPCAWMLERIDPFLDGELNAEESRVFEAHVETCGECREELSFARSVLGELRGMPALNCPDGVTEAVCAGLDRKVERGPARRWFGSWLFQPAVAGALVVVAVTAAFLLARMQENRGEFTPAEIARAKAEVEWTLAYVGDVSRWTGRTFQQEVLEERIVTPMTKAVHSAIEGGGTSTPTIETNGG